jgi:ABC-type nitrate/sulfonate/bicarbonate transport system permease component
VSKRTWWRIWVGLIAANLVLWNGVLCGLLWPALFPQPWSVVASLVDGVVFGCFVMGLARRGADLIVPREG